ncbi:MAG: hypothetical protein OEU09_15500 [Rhodospirillales bacterium]|nr:hypothetical protein [Rhodospirillales bacterium]MDH3916955.1 hypothetical protein [Rhodospirillales bacterium]MDH3967294.1 hypothetical protein [Rhodospirillales bacterium]
MRTALWLTNALLAGVLAFLLGYGVSAETGVEPGFFEAVETGGYGAGAGGDAATEGISEEYQNYYESLSE